MAARTSKRGANKGLLSMEEVALKGAEYIALKNTEKELKTQLTNVRTPLETAMDSYESVGSDGNKYVIAPLGGSEIVLKRTQRVSKELVPEAIDILKQNGLDSLVESVEIVREDRIQQYLEEGKLTEKFVSALYTLKETYAFSVSQRNKLDLSNIDD